MLLIDLIDSEDIAFKSDKQKNMKSNSSCIKSFSYENTGPSVYLDRIL